MLPQKTPCDDEKAVESPLSDTSSYLSKSIQDDEKSAQTVPVPPNGGLLAWSQVVGSFCIYLNTWGVISMFGVFQTYYSKTLTGSDPSSISWIGSIQVCLAYLCSPIVGPIYDAGYCRTLLVVGTLLTVLGIFSTSFCSSYWQLVLAQGVAIGLGSGCLFLPGVAILCQYFSTKKALATGLASVGSSIGGIIYPIIWTQLQERIGFGQATRVVGFIVLATLMVPLVCLRPIQYPCAKRRWFHVESFSDVPYVLFALGMLFGFMGISVVGFYIEMYATARADVTPEMGFFLLALINAGSALGRILPNFAADYVGLLNMQIAVALCSAVLSFALLGIGNTQGVIAFCVLFGFFTGPFASLPTPIVASLTTDLSTLGGRLSMAFIACGFGGLIGSPIAGVILSTRGGDNWTGLQIWSGALLALGTLSMCGARTAKVGLKVSGRV